MSQIILSGEANLERELEEPRAHVEARSKNTATAGNSANDTANVLVIAEWIEQHGDAVRGYLRAMTGRHDVADDLWQEVFQRAWRASDSYSERGTARAYLIRIADRLLCDCARKQQRRSAETQLDAEGWRRLDPASGEPPPDRRMEATEAGQRLRVALAALSPAQQRVLLLRYYGELSFVAIAETTARPLNTVLSDCRRGLESLRKVLGENER